MVNDFHLIWFDPGVTTGWAWFVVSRKAYSRPEHTVLGHIRDWNCGEFTGAEDDVLLQCLRLVDRSRDEVSYLRIKGGTENFELTQLIGSRKNLLSPVRINAVLDWEFGKRALKLQYQQRSIRTSITKERLRLFGFGSRFRRNEFAAMQHGIVYLRRLKRESIKNPWKLDIPDILNGGGYDCSCQIKKKCNLLHPQ